MLGEKWYLLQVFFLILKFLFLFAKTNNNNNMKIIILVSSACKQNILPQSDFKFYKVWVVFVLNLR